MHGWQDPGGPSLESDGAAEVDSPETPVISSRGSRKGSGPAALRIRLGISTLLSDCSRATCLNTLS